MSIRIENYVHNTSLYGFGFGMLQKFYLENILRVEYVVYDLESDHQYLVDMNVSVCFEFAGPCELTSTMFHKTFLPKMPCQWQTGFIQTDFSLAAWRIENDIGPTALLYPVDIARLIKELGLGDYLMDSPCSRLNGSYVPHSRCGKIVNKPVLPTNTHCYIPESCTSFKCCQDVDVISSTFETSIELDPCNFLLKIRIEKLTFDVTFFDFAWGGPETSHHVIFKNTLFPKQSCDWSSDFHISNFSYNKWATDRGHNPDESLPSDLLAKLLEETNLQGYLKEPQCELSTNWTKDCAMNITLPPLSSDVSCHVTSLCTGIQCCVDNELLNRTLDFSILLDPCEKRLSISIEQTRYNTTFSNINWGVNQYFNLQGMIRIEYNIDDLYSERYFLVNARVLFCYEASQACSAAYTVLNNTMLPKVTCNWNDGFLQSGFSLSNWYTEHDQTTGDKLDDWAISVFLDDLGLSPFLDTSACNVDPSFVYVNNDSWTNECIKSVNLPSITTTTDRTRCLMRTSCTAVDCCTDVDFIPKSFKTYLHIDPCRQELVIGIEKYMRNISLSTYKWVAKMENVLIVSVVKHSDKNNNKAYILKNTATQTKCRTFRELYQEAIERCSDAQSEIINIKTIQISKSNSFDDSSIEISDENMVWSICNDLNFKYVQFTIDDGSTATKDASNSKPSGINAFSVLMSSQNELHMPDKPVPLSGKQLTGPQRLYSDIIDWASNIDSMMHLVEILVIT
ncbi:Hypothetical predicted protein [Mytilus galloprovincialis]|uniref:Uncharacterized protein n=2 Tax=Mytilus TaxID=6548 RepID=A0A8B6EZ80_MYTGA|nr:Hypothetical predicted protein [Mytilus galloprovincialis]